MRPPSTQSVLLPVILVSLFLGIGGNVVGAPGVDGGGESALGTQPELSSHDENLTQSLQQLSQSVRGSSLGNFLSGKKVTFRVTDRDGTTETRGVVFGRAGSTTVRQTGFSDPALTARLSNATLDSIVSAGDSSAALEKAVKYDLVSITGTGVSNQIASSIGTQGIKHGKKSRIAANRIDLDGDSRPDAILEIEALNTDGDPEFDRLIRTVIRDADGDGDMETVDSETRPIRASVMGSTNLDMNDDDTRDTGLQLTGKDTNADGRLDRQRKVTLVDTRGDKQFDSFSETIKPATGPTEVTGEWDLNDDGEVSARIVVEGKDTDGDDLFDRRIMTVALNLDGEPGFESKSETKARINPTLSISAEFDTDDDGDPDTKATLSTSDSNGDGGLDTEETSVVNDSDDDGVYDRIVERDQSRRGFISNTGKPIKYLDDPKNLTIVGVLASILSMLLQLIQGN